MGTRDLLFPLLKTDLLRAFAPEDTDLLENYVLRTGLRRSQWQSVWKFHSPFHLEDDSGMPTPGELEELNLMNRYLSSCWIFSFLSRTDGAKRRPSRKNAPFSTGGSWSSACRIPSPAGMR